MNLNEEQEGAVKALRLAKERVAQRLIEAENRFAIEKYDLEAPVRTAATEAYKAGVPVRRIGQALDIQNYSVIKGFILSDVQEHKPVPVVKGESNVEFDGNNLYFVTDTAGRVWEFWHIDFDGELFVEESATSPRSADTRGKPVPQEVMKLLREHIRAGADFSSITTQED